ncbi:MAG: hypothetical protein HY996_05610 [Micrococcales bacterium]|nr:hypothetical protein [Micrococcales bacterium]
MASSRKRAREFRKLKSRANSVAAEQRAVLDHASQVLREARRQLGDYARTDVAPAAMRTYDSRLKPTVARSVAASRAAAHTGRTRLADDVIPALAGAIGSTLASLDSARDPRVRAVAKKAGKQAAKYGAQARKAVRPQESSSPVRLVVVAVSLVAAGAVAYAAWQTLRADDELWIEDVADVDPVSPEA